MHQRSRSEWIVESDVFQDLFRFAEIVSTRADRRRRRSHRAVNIQDLLIRFCRVENPLTLKEVKISSIFIRFGD